MKCNAEIYILTFTITALYDVILRKLSENYNKIPSFLQLDFVLYLKPYFKKHTLLDAALIAGFVGAVTQMIILNVHKLPTTLYTFTTFMIATFIISALFGFVMKFSKLFPNLVNNFYNDYILKDAYLIVTEFGTPNNDYRFMKDGLDIHAQFLLRYPKYLGIEILSYTDESWKGNSNNNNSYGILTEGGEKKSTYQAILDFNNLN